jgi:hypothetical protein
MPKRQGIFAWCLVRPVHTCAAAAACCAPAPPWRRLTSTAGIMTPCASFGRTGSPPMQHKAQKNSLVVQKEQVYEAFASLVQKASGYSKPPTRPTFCKRVYELGEDIPRHSNPAPRICSRDTAGPASGALGCATLRT